MADAKCKKHLPLLVEPVIKFSEDPIFKFNFCIFRLVLYRLKSMGKLFLDLVANLFAHFRLLVFLFIPYIFVEQSSSIHSRYLVRTIPT